MQPLVWCLELGPELEGSPGTAGKGGEEPPSHPADRKLRLQPLFYPRPGVPQPFPPGSPGVSCMGEGMKKVGIEASSPPGPGFGGKMVK